MPAEAWAVEVRWTARPPGAGRPGDVVAAAGGRDPPRRPGRRLRARPTGRRRSRCGCCASRPATSASAPTARGWSCAPPRSGTTWRSARARRARRHRPGAGRSPPGSSAAAAGDGLTVEPPGALPPVPPLAVRVRGVTYTGNVGPGGRAGRTGADRPDHHQGLGRRKMDNNAYLLRCRTTGEQVLIDAANDADRLLGLIGDGGLSTVVTTHQHHDHWYALEDVLEATGARSVAHAGRRRAAAAGRPDRRGWTDDPGRRLLARGHPPRRPHARLDRAALPRPGRHRPPVHRRLPLPGRGRQHPGQRRELHLADQRRRAEDLRPAARRHVVLPGPRQRLHARRRAPVAARVARPRLVTSAPSRREKLTGAFVVLQQLQ